MVSCGASRSRSAHGSPASRRAGTPTSRRDDEVDREGADHANAPPREVLWVVGGAGTDRATTRALREFPLINRSAGESEAAHLLRVLQCVDEAVAQGGTHLVVPQQVAEWLDDHPLVATHFAQHHELVEASPDTGIVFALRSRRSDAFDIEVSGWHVVPSEVITFTAESRLVDPKATLRLRSPAPGPLTGSIVFTAAGLQTLRLGFVMTRSGHRGKQQREAVFSLTRIGYVIHDLPFFAATFQHDGSVRVEFDLKLTRGRTLERIELGIVDEDNWRLHPTYPGGTSLSLPAVARAGARLELSEFVLTPAQRVRKGPPYGIVNGERPAPYRKPASRQRDAVIFSSWVPKEGLVLGDYFLETLRRWHADSKIFVGVNHGSAPQWLARLERSGLDLTIARAGSELTMPFDPTGFVAALNAYRRHEESFALVWFGHNKGGDHLADQKYATGRWMIERMFWSRREEVERYFEDPIIGLYAPHYLMLLQEHLTQTDALCRMYPAPCAPLHTMAVSAHFVMRDESVREFCARVDRQFFRYGPEPYGGDRFFFEMAMPNVPIMQGYEPYIEPGFGGTGIHPKITGVQSILNDWRQNHAVVAFELEKWRQSPTSFRTRHREHNRVD